MWPFKKKGISIQPGEGKDLFFDIPTDKEIGEVVLNYDDKYGNKYETRVLVNFKERKIIIPLKKLNIVLKKIGQDLI